MMSICYKEAKSVNKDSPIRSLSMAPSVSVLTGFDYTYFFYLVTIIFLDA